ncbi:MAG TPA: hypothetical protein VG496_12400 [Myxococcales bacterium]|nr:hypothetical protein [Myxococcales bacterium]
MRSACSVLLALVLCACGNLSNDDIPFLEALPRTGDLHVQIPQQSTSPAGSSALSACTLGEAQQWLLGAKDTGDKLNLAVDAVLGIIDAIRHATPTSRQPNLRVWSFPDSKHPGVQMEASLLRVPQAPGANPAQQPWSFAIDARRGGGPYLEVLYAYFIGSDARTGLGEITINFDSSRALQINGPNDPVGTMTFHYDLSGDPRTVQIGLGAVGLGLSQFDYFYAGFSNGSGEFDYIFPDSANNVFSLQTAFTAQGAGKAHIFVRAATGQTGTLDECWDTSACLTYVLDPLSVTPICSGILPPLCVQGNINSCPAVP